MKKVFSFGEFFGITRESFDTSSYKFVLVRDYADKRVPVHTHETAHFIFITNGAYESKVKDKKKLCSVQTSLFHPAGTTHRDHFESEFGQFLTISLKKDVEQRLMDGITFYDYSTDFEQSDIFWLGRRMLKEIVCGDDLSGIVLEGMANELLVYASRNLENSPHPPGWLKTAYELINDKCRENITVAEIAKAVNVHPIHLARTFKQFYKTSPGEYLRKRKLDYASSLLINTDKSLAEVALLSGYTDQSHLTRSFRREIGITPKKFREIHT